MHKPRKIFILSCLVLVSTAAIADITDPYIATTDTFFSKINHPSNPTLHDFLINMPKGGDLHNHLAGAIYPQWIISQVKSDTSRPNWCAYPTNYKAVVDPNCVNNHGILFRNLSQGTQDYDNIMHAWSMLDFPLQAPLYGHDHFFSIFGKNLLIKQQYSPQLLAELMQQAAQEHINYLELMVHPDGAGPFPATNYANYITALPTESDLKRSTTTLTYSQANLATLQLEQHNFTSDVVDSSVIDNAQNLLTATKNLLGCNTTTPQKACSVVVKFQYEAKRCNSLAQFFTTLYAGFKAASLAPNLFVGVNLVGPEDNNTALQDYNAQMLLINYMRHYFNNTVHVSLHAGELTDRLPNIVANPADLTYHINNAINIAHADRIGHAVDITAELKHYPNLLQEMKDRHIPVEVNLTSNEQILGVCDQAPYCLPPSTSHNSSKQFNYNHPFYLLLNSKVPVTLSTDDQGIEQTYLAAEYYKAASRYDLSYSQLKDIDRNSLTFSFLPGKQLWATIGDYTHLVQNCSHDNPYSETSPSKACQAYLNTNLRAQLEWNLEKEFAQFEKTTNSSIDSL